MTLDSDASSFSGREKKDMIISGGTDSASDLDIDVVPQAYAYSHHDHDQPHQVQLTKMATRNT